jgi:hypothetical protein
MGEASGRWRLESRRDLCRPSPFVEFTGWENCVPASLGADNAGCDVDRRDGVAEACGLKSTQT